MRELFRLFIHAMDSQMTRERPGLMQRAVCGLAAGLCLLSALAAGMTSLWIYLLPIAGPAGAPLAIAGVLLVAGLLFLALARRRPVLVVADPSRDPGYAAAATNAFASNKSALLLALFTAAFQSGTRR